MAMPLMIWKGRQIILLCARPTCTCSSSISMIQISYCHYSQNLVKSLLLLAVSLQTSLTIYANISKPFPRASFFDSRKFLKQHYACRDSFPKSKKFKFLELSSLYFGTLKPRVYGEIPEKKGLSLEIEILISLSW